MQGKYATPPFKIQKGIDRSFFWLGGTNMKLNKAVLWLSAIISLTASLIEAQQTFRHPQVEGVFVDWCLNWSADCGKPAADRFCQMNGFNEVNRFEVARQIGKTRVLGTGQECGPTCDGFAYIECVSSSSAPKPRVLRERRPATPSEQSPQMNVLPLLVTTYPDGASIWYLAGDIAMTADFPAHGKSARFFWNVSKIKNAQGVIWQVNQAPFDIWNGPTETTLHPPQIAASGQASGVQGSFLVDFAKIPRPPLGMGRTSGPQPLWYVRVLPTSSDFTVVGKPSNLIRVFDDKAPSGTIDSINLGQWYTKPGGMIRLVKFEFEPFREYDQWPPGCERNVGMGNQETAWSWAGGALSDTLDWTSETYSDLKGYVVSGVLIVLPFVPRSVAEAALDAALASCGIPPNIPTTSQLTSVGADYLANQMADQFANQVPAGSELAQLGKEAMRKKIQQQTRDAIIENAKAAQDALAAKSKVCRDMKFPPFLKITIQNAGSQIYRNLEVRVGYTKMDIEHNLNWKMLRAWKPIRITQLDPGEYMTIPVDIFSQMELQAVPEDPNVSYSTRDIPHWIQMYRNAHFSFTVKGGQTITYRAYSEDGPHSEERIVEDGTGFSYTTPEQQWVKEPFVGW
jgi:hypothetical protein